MSNPIVAVALGNRILQREDFKTNFLLLEQIVTDHFLTGSSTHVIDETTVSDLLRFTDILSHSTEALHRELAYATIALLREHDELVGFSEKLRDRVLAVSEAVLIELGNFPGIKTLQKGIGGKFALPLSREAIRSAKEILHTTSRGNAVLTDTQFEIVEKMRAEDFFSFSGPTSLGKSFIIKDALYDIIRRPELNEQCVVVLVPTKALIGQTSADLRELFVDMPDVNVATYPSLPKLLRKQYSRTIFVLTPERLLRYLARPVRKIKYLVVDEAQKIIAKNDARSSLYYHAIGETTRRFATKLIFASPNIKNPELFLELFGVATNGALAIRERTVAQQRFFVDLVNRKQYHFSALTQRQRELTVPPQSLNSLDLVIERSGNRKTIIYINSSTKASHLALEMAERVPLLNDFKINELIKHVKEYIHHDYFLAKTLRHGVAFHHGKMPQEIREKIEAIFSDQDSPLQYVICTSTLLEGVNLPAKNIFVLSDKHGSRNFTNIDFENLIGRAGRLTYDFSGNVICVREAEKRWSDATRELISRSEPDTAESFLVRPKPSRRKEYTDIACVLSGKNLPGKPSENERRNVQQYAAILTLHQIDNQETPLRNFFLAKVPDGRDVLKKATVLIQVPTNVLSRAPDILPEYQNAVWEYLTKKEGLMLLDTSADISQLDTFQVVLERLSELYNWRKEESRGTEPLVPGRATPEAFSRRLTYWAILMRSWVKGEPLSKIINNSIDYFIKRGKIYCKDYSQSDLPIKEEDFDPNSAKHINIVIEDTLRDIEGGLRFHIMSYLQNFYDIDVAARGADKAGINIATLVEYGTTDSRAIELQEIGFSRNTASKLLIEHAASLHFSSQGELESIDTIAILGDENIDKDVEIEVKNILVKSQHETSSTTET